MSASAQALPARAIDQCIFGTGPEDYWFQWLSWTVCSVCGLRRPALKRPHRLGYLLNVTAPCQARKQLCDPSPDYLEAPCAVPVLRRPARYNDADPHRNPEPAEEAYNQSLAIKVRIGNLAGQASTLGQLGNL